MTFGKVGVLGCGLMGSGVAEVCARAGCEVVVREVSQDLIERGKAKIVASLARAVEKGKLAAADRDALLGRICFTTNLRELAGCNLVIEAIIEDLEQKGRILRELDSIAPPETIFATNTSSLTVTELAATTARPDRFAGLHFFNPVAVMKLVEVVRGVATSDVTHATLVAFARELGKEPITAHDNSGFVVNRLLIPYLFDAIRALEEGVGSKEDIDRGMKLGCGYPMGPFELMDFIGLDTLLHIAEVMFEEYREKRFAPPGLLRRLVWAGRLGRKSGNGFYVYEE